MPSWASSGAKRSASSIGLRAILVVDNVAKGPSIGGVRMAPDVSVEECVRLARAMTFKNAAAGLRHGGAKSGIIADPDMPDDAKERLVRAFAHAMRDVTDYIQVYLCGSSHNGVVNFLRQKRIHLDLVKARLLGLSHGLTRFYRITQPGTQGRWPGSVGSIQHRC